ncbi:FAD-dependent oxidoreductase [Humisphaera borealis]|uniref:FAD-dependent oxidoreductase n=1 Tax=Humisphaera borealis TaxID=2807512 RepID=A0A7M2WYI0_9BACT|nr:FAD-dependent oxidoreductase [Humisphaera borealis]
MSNAQSIPAELIVASGANPSGRTDPIWYRDYTPPSFSALKANIRSDVCIVGAGIAGLMAAYLLAKAGLSVTVLEAKEVGGGESGRTSAHLASAIDDRFYEIERAHG